MQIVFFSNFLNHHQKPVADVLASTAGIDYIFVETVPMFNWLKKGGYTDYSHVSYVLRAWENDENMEKAVNLAKTADVALFAGSEVLFLEVIRAKYTDKISLEVSERWLKRGWINLLSPRLLKRLWFYHTLFKHKPYYKLCQSAFGAGDEYKLRCYRDKCYKWGYFTTINESFEVESANLKKSSRNIIYLMWCARFLRWKHPELPVMLAAKLKKEGYKFQLDIYGGEGNAAKYDVVYSKKELESLIMKLNVDDCVCLKGNAPNEEILSAMRSHDIFLFTSDNHEGWGAVANEAMSNGCVLVGSDAIGSIPFLLTDMKNGLIFKSEEIDSLYEKVKFLIDNEGERNRMSINGYKSMRDIWSPKNAAQSLILLIENLMQGNDTPILDGPCSKAFPI